jgi:hypothetical protein
MLVIAAALAMILSGCGGDDNGGLSADDMARIDNAEASAATAMAEAMAAAAAQAEAEADAATAMAAQMTAEAEAMAAKAGQTEAEGDAADAAIAQTAAEAAQAAAEAAQTAAENARDAAVAAEMAAQTMITELQAEIAALEADQPYDPTQPGGTLEGVGGRAGAQRIEEGTMISLLVRETLDRNLTTDPQTAPAPGLANDVGFPADLEPGDPDYDKDVAPRRVIPDDVEIADLKQSRLGTAAELTLGVEGGTGLATAMDSAAMDAPAITGFTGVALEKDGPGAVTQMALVYSDAERSVRAFGDVYEYTLNDAGNSALSQATRTHLEVLRTVPTTVAKVGDQDPNISITHGLSTTTGVTERAFTSAGGSYDGVAGQYMCLADACMLSLDADGDLAIVATSASSGLSDLIFRANNAEALLPDTDYLAFGVWTEVPDSPTLANPGRVRAFVGASAAIYKYRHLPDLAGSASYSGGAVGHYATRAQGAHTAEMGRFTASATLTANFDPSATALLSGMVDTFMDEDGTEMAGWLVNLDGGAMITEVFITTPGTPPDEAFRDIDFIAATHYASPVPRRTATSTAPPAAPPAARRGKAGGTPGCSATTWMPIRPAWRDASLPPWERRSRSAPRKAASISLMIRAFRA